MALTNYERQQRWRDKNRVVYNLRRRNARKKLSGVRGSGVGSATVGQDSECKLSSAPSQQSNTIESLRSLIKMEEERVVEPERKPLIYRNDFGAIISESQWHTLQNKKREAKEGGYEMDEWSQV